MWLGGKKKRHVKEASSLFSRVEASEERVHVEEMVSEHAVFIVRCKDGTCYTGYTKDIPRRIATHNTGNDGHSTRMLEVHMEAMTWFKQEYFCGRSVDYHATRHKGCAR
jgi:hypothetical protein